MSNLEAKEPYCDCTCYEEGYGAGQSFARPYEAALRELVEAVKASDEDSIGAYQYAALHGMLYTGRQHGEALAKAEAVLGE